MPTNELLQLNIADYFRILKKAFSCYVIFLDFNKNQKIEYLVCGVITRYKGILDQLAKLN